MEINKVYNEDCLKTIKRMPDDFVDLAITSPPYFGCRAYGSETLGREENPLDYVENLANTLKPLKRVLKSTGSFYLNIGDVYFGTKGFSRSKGKYARKTNHHYQEHKICKEDDKYLQHKQLLLLPERIAIKLQEDGWILRNKIIWEKPNSMPTFSKDRRLPVYETIFHFVKSKKYYFNYDLAKKIKSHRDIIQCSIEKYKDHQATFPEKLIDPLIQTTSKEGDLVYDMFSGSGTTCKVAHRLYRKYLGSEITKYEFFKEHPIDLEDSIF